MVVQVGETDTCLKDPGREVNLQVQTCIRNLATTRMDEESVSVASDAGRLVAQGDSTLRDSMQAWLGLSILVLAGGE